MGKIQVLSFGAAADRAGLRCTEVPVSDQAKLAEICLLLTKRPPIFFPLRDTLAFAKNGVYAGMEAAFSPGEEVPVLSPVSGG